MDKTALLYFLFCFLLIMFDIIIIFDARRLLLGFLIGQRNRKNAQKIHTEQNFKDRVNLGYIQPMLNKNEKPFKRYHTLYLVILSSAIPQYLAIILFHVFAPNIAKYIFIACLVIRFLLACFYRSVLGAQRISVYAQKK